jgi:hypothetical protein
MLEGVGAHRTGGRKGGWWQMRAVAHYAVLAVLLVLIALLVVRLLARLRHGFEGYRFGTDVVVRCRDGHLFTTVWLPLMSFKSIRLGLLRSQYCPVGGHWTLVRLMKDSDLTDAERLIAAQVHDGPVT